VRPRETQDPWGRRVVLTSSGWSHVREQHPELLPLIDEVLEVVTTPDAITPDPKRGRWRYWRAGVGPTRWVRVIVNWNKTPAEIHTAFPDGDSPLR